MKLYYEDGILLCFPDGPNYNSPLLCCDTACGYWWASFPAGVAEGSESDLQAGLSIDGTTQKQPLPKPGGIYRSQELLEKVVAHPGQGEEALGDSDSRLHKINCRALQEVYHCHPRLAASRLAASCLSPRLLAALPAVAVGTG